MNKGNNKNT